MDSALNPQEHMRAKLQWHTTPIVKGIQPTAAAPQQRKEPIKIDASSRAASLFFPAAGNPGRRFSAPAAPAASAAPARRRRRLQQRLVHGCVHLIGRQVLADGGCNVLCIQFAPTAAAAAMTQLCERPPRRLQPAVFVGVLEGLQGGM